MALSHKEPDRIPIDNNPPLSGIHEVAYKNLLKYLNLKDEIRIVDPVQGLADLSRKVREILKIDMYYIFTNPPSDYIFEENPDKSFKDEFGTVYRKIGYYADIFKPVLKGKTFSEVKEYKFPDPTDKNRFLGLKEKAKELSENTGYSLWSGTGSSILYTGWCLKGVEEFIMDLCADPKMAKYLMDKIMEWNLAFTDNLYKEIGSFIDVFWVGDDLGTQNGPYVSPDYFRKELLPRYSKIISFVKSKTRAKCAFHSCGSIDWCLEDLINIGVDIIHPIQANARGNDIKVFKEKYGKKVVFHGGTNNQGVFHKDIHTLTIDTLNRIKYLAPNGGYIFSSGHNVQANMPPENVMRLFELAHEYSKYPINIDRIEERIEREKELLKKK